MKTIVLAAAATLLISTAAQASCFVVADPGGWAGPQQQTALALCQQRELALATERQAEAARIAAELAALAIEAERRLQQQRAAARLAH